MLELRADEDGKMGRWVGTYRDSIVDVLGYLLRVKIVSRQAVALAQGAGVVDKSRHAMTSKPSRHVGHKDLFGAVELVERMVFGKHEFGMSLLAGLVGRRGVHLGLSYCTVENHRGATLGTGEQPAAQGQAIHGSKLDIFALLGHSDGTNTRSVVVLSSVENFALRASCILPGRMKDKFAPMNIIENLRQSH